MTTGQTLEQRRAAHAWKAVQRICSSQHSKDYRREAKRLPLRIVTAGLGHAIAFANAKKGANAEVAEDVARWVLGRLVNGPGVDNGVHARSLMCRIVEKDADWLRRATEEALAYLQWLSRFAEAEIKDEGSGS